MSQTKNIITDLERQIERLTSKRTNLMEQFNDINDVIQHKSILLQMFRLIDLGYIPSTPNNSEQQARRVTDVSGRNRRGRSHSPHTGTNSTRRLFYGKK